MTALTWNIESLKKHIFVLRDILKSESPSLAFLSEPQVFQADISLLCDYIKEEYCYFLNSEDLYDPDLPLTTNHAVGGTLCLWKRSLDPFITVHHVTTSAFIPLILAMPHHQVSIHICIYLPTYGKDSQFVADLAELRVCIDDILDKHPNALVFVRGDGNVNAKNKRRVDLLNHFVHELRLRKCPH